MKQNLKQTISVVAGHLFEHYDVTLYGFFAVLLAPIFFPTGSVYSAQIASFGAFAAGFLMRPLGGFIFGYIGDHYGRRRALLLSMSLAVLPTLLIGLLPTYESIGLAASILLVLLRLAQGVSVGGEYSGAVIYIFEHSYQKRPALKAGFLIGSGFAGAVLGTLMGTLCTSSLMPSWGWRIPFIVGGIMGLVIYLMRQGIQETPEFKALSDLHKLSESPLKHIFSLHKKEFFCCVVFGGANLVPLYLATVYINSWFVELGATRAEILLDNTIVLLSSGLLMPFAGIIADRVGAFKLMKVALTFLIVGSIPLYVYVAADPSWENYLLLQGGLVLLNACIITPLTCFLPTLFPAAHRYTGLSVSYTLGQAILGGLTPLIATVLTASIGEKWAPSLLLCGASCLFLVCLRLCQKPRENKLN